MYEENNIEYMPNRMYKYLLVVFLWIIIWIIREIKYIMTHINSTDTEIILFFVFLLCISVVCGVACYRLSKLKIIFTKDAIYIKHHGQQEVNV